MKSQDPQPAGTTDLRPLPPREPALEECCQRGCEPCVFDRYYEAMERYQVALQSWLERHPDQPPGPDEG